MKVLLLGRRSLLAAALAREMTRLKIPFDWLSYQEITANLTSSFLSSFSHVFNCIAYTQVDEAEEDVLKAYHVNAFFPTHLAKMAKAASCKLIHYSTDYVFDGNCQSMYTEQVRAAPLSVYGKSKLEGENGVFEAQKTALVIRTSWVYGMGKQNFVSAILKKLLNEEEIRVTSDQFNKSTSTIDLAQGTMHLLKCEGLFHFANHGVISRFEFASSILKTAQKLGLPIKCKRLTPVLTKEFQTKATRPLFSALNTDKYERVTHQVIDAYEKPLEKYLTDLKESGLCL